MRSSEPEAAHADGLVRPVESLTLEEAKDEHDSLVREIKRHDRLYYQDAQPEISDADYDRLRLRTEALEARFPSLITAESPTQKVGAAPSEKFAKVRHSVQDAVARERVQRRGCRGVRHAGPALSETGGRRAAGLYRREQDRRPVGFAAL